MFSAQRSLLVGDPQQLPPTLRTSPSHSSPPDDLSKTAFVRLQRAGVEPVMLRTQYRCHPCISLLSSRLFYGGELQDAASTDNNNERLVKWLPPLCFVDISDGQHVLGEGGSLQNSVELRVISDILRQLLSVEQISPDMIGVISLYKAQARRINASLSTLGADCESIQVSTVDAFQGAERDIIVLSTVRSSGIGFSSDPNRLNVALTRARSHLIIVGCKRALSTNNTWHRIIQYAGASAGLDAPFRLSPSAAVLRTSVSNAADLLPACNTNTKDSPGPTTTVGHYANDSLHAEVPQAQSNPQECTEFNHWVIGNQQKIAQEEESSPQSGTEFNHWVIGNQQKNAQEEESSPQSGTEFNHWVIGSQQENAQEAESSPQPGTEFNHWVIGNQHKIAQQEESSPQSGTELNHWVIGNQQGNTQQEESNPQPGTEFNHWVIGNQQGNMERARSILEEASGSDHQAIDIRLDNAANVSSCLRENAIPKESGSPHFIVESQMSQDKAIAKSFAGSEEPNGISESNDSYWRSGTQRPQNSAVKTSTIQSRSKVEDELPAASDFDDIDLLF